MGILLGAEKNLKRTKEEASLNSFLCSSQELTAQENNTFFSSLCLMRKEDVKFLATNTCYQRKVGPETNSEKSDKNCLTSSFQ